MPSALLFNVGCNKQVFSPVPGNKFDANPSCHFQEKRKKRSFNFEK